MQHATAVGVGDGVAHLDQHFDVLGQRDLGLAQVVLEAVAGQPLHHHEVESGVVDRDDVRMLDRGRGQAFLAEGVKVGGVGLLRVHRLDRHFAAGRALPRQMDHAHAAGADAPEQDVGLLALVDRIEHVGEPARVLAHTADLRRLLRGGAATLEPLRPRRRQMPGEGRTDAHRRRQFGAFGGGECAQPIW